MSFEHLAYIHVEELQTQEITPSDASHVSLTVEDKV